MKTDLLPTDGGTLEMFFDIEWESYYLRKTVYSLDNVTINTSVCPIGFSIISPQLHRKNIVEARVIWNEMVDVYGFETYEYY